MKRLPLLSLAVLAAAVAGCGSSSSSGGSSSGSGSGSSTGSSSQGTKSVGGTGTVVKMKNIQFNPKAITVKVGQTIKWENLDSVDHNVTATSGGSFKSSDFGNGGTFTFTPKQAGTIKYTCTLHPGMDGEIKVTG